MRAFINTPTAADVAPPEPLPVLGKLVARPASLKRGKGELTNVLDRYLDNAISTTEKRNRCKEELALLSMMETLVKEVIGRDKDDKKGRAEIEPSLAKTLALINAKGGVEAI